MTELGEVFTINWRVHGHVNSAAIYYFHKEIDVFLHRFDDGELALLVDQDWLDEADEHDREYARAHVDGVPVPDDPFEHQRVDQP